MSEESGIIAVIPARDGSKGLKGKNIRPLAGLPLIAHSILFARMCPEITAVVVSTDSSEIANVARQFDCTPSFMRPDLLATDDTPLWPVVRHALKTIENQRGVRYEYLILLDPTSPTRLPEDVREALQELRPLADADGIIGVSEPEFNPIWHCVVKRDGWMNDFLQAGGDYERRQDVPIVYRINGSLYIWRSRFVRQEEESWRRNGRHLIHTIPDLRGVSIDTLSQFERTEALIRSGLIQLPWLDPGN